MFFIQFATQVWTMSFLGKMAMFVFVEMEKLLSHQKFIFSLAK